MRASGASSGCAIGETISPAQVESVKMGTTVATNALLERRGEPTVLVTTRGFRDALRIATQARPRLFARHIVLPELLYETVIEADERVDAGGDVITPLDAVASQARARSAPTFRGHLAPVPSFSCMPIARRLTSSRPRRWRGARVSRKFRCRIA